MLCSLRVKLFAGWHVGLTKVNLQTHCKCHVCMFTRQTRHPVSQSVSLANASRGPFARARAVSFTQCQVTDGSHSAPNHIRTYIYASYTDAMRRGLGRCRRPETQESTPPCRRSRASWQILEPIQRRLPHGKLRFVRGCHPHAMQRALSEAGHAGRQRAMREYEYAHAGCQSGQRLQLPRRSIG